MRKQRHSITSAAALLAIVFLDTSCGKSKTASTADHPPSDGPGIDVNPHPHERGNANAGKQVFHFETFGNEGFWTDAARLPQGIMQAKLTPKQALQAGLQIDSEAIEPAMREALARELKTDLSLQNAPLMNDVATTMKLIEANAVVGVVAVDSNGDGQMRIAPAGQGSVAFRLHA